MPMLAFTLIRVHEDLELCAMSWMQKIQIVTLIWGITIRLNTP
jgi:hypothetical protein